MGNELQTQVVARFVELNGEHPTTPADDEYVETYFTPLDSLSWAPDDIRAHILTGRLPLPSYLRSDGMEMVPADLLALAEQAGGADELPAWFAQQGWPTAQAAANEWRAYLSGQYVCLWSVTPENIRRKEELVSAIDAALGQPQPTSSAWLANLHELVDELDALEPPFTPYDRLRFGGPVSRDTHIDQVRTQYPRGN